MNALKLARPNTSLIVREAPFWDIELAARFGSIYSDLKSGQLDIYEPSDLDEFLTIDTYEKAEAFCAKHPLLFGSAWLVDDFDDYSVYWGVLRSVLYLEITLRLYALDKEALAGFELPDKVYSGIENLYNEVEQERPMFTFHYVSVDGEAGTLWLESEINPYTEMLCTFAEPSRFPAHGDYLDVLNPWHYSYWPCPEYDSDDDEETIVDAFEDARETMDYKPADIEGMVTLYCKMKDTESQQEQERSVTWRDVADEMMTLHLRGIQTVMQGGNEQRRASVGVSALWWLAADRMRYGRVFQCAACGKVGIATDERGHKRRFCSDACKQWKSKHPNETRPPRQ